MATWFSCKIRFTKEISAGKFQAVTEEYLIDAVSFTDAEAILYDLLGDNAPDFRVVAISPFKVQEVFHVEGPEIKWFKVKIVITTFDEKAKKEKKSPALFLVNAASIKQAYDRVEEALGWVEDYEITDVSLTAILEVVPYEGDRKSIGEVLSKALKSFDSAGESDSLAGKLQEMADQDQITMTISTNEQEVKIIPKKLKTGKDYAPPSKNQSFPKINTVNFD